MEIEIILRFLNSLSSLSKKILSVSQPTSRLLGHVLGVGVLGNFVPLLSLGQVIHDQKTIETSFFFSHIILKCKEHDKYLYIVIQSECTWDFAIHKLYSEVVFVSYHLQSSNSLRKN